MRRASCQRGSSAFGLALPMLRNRGAKPAAFFVDGSRVCMGNFKLTVDDMILSRLYERFVNRHVMTALTCVFESVVYGYASLISQEIWRVIV